MRLARISQDKSALDSAENVALLSAAISGELTARGQSGDGVGLMLPLGPGGRLGKVSTQGGSDVGPLSVAKHVDEVQVGRHQRLERAVEHQRFNRASPVAQGFARPLDFVCFVENELRFAEQDLDTNPLWLRRFGADERT